MGPRFRERENAQLFTRNNKRGAKGKGICSMLSTTIREAPTIHMKNRSLKLNRMKTNPDSPQQLFLKEMKKQYQEIRSENTIQGMRVQRMLVIASFHLQNHLHIKQRVFSWGETFLNCLQTLLLCAVGK